MSKSIFCNFGTEYRKDGRPKQLGCYNQAKFEFPGYHLKKDTPVRSCGLHLARTLNERILWVNGYSVEIKRIEKKDGG